MGITEGPAPDIASRVKSIERLKAKLLSDVSGVYEIMAGGSVENIDEKLGEIIISAYILGKKMGYEYSDIDNNILNMLKLMILSHDTPELEYNELSAWVRDRNRQQ